MRFVICGASEVAVRTAELLLEKEHDVIVIEADRARIDELRERLDCSFLHGDGSKPELLREAGPRETDILFCLTDNDQDNIIASLVGRSLGYERVVTSVRDPDYQPICRELGLEEVIVPARTIARYLADAASGIDVMELSTLIRSDARLFSFVVGGEAAGAVEALELPSGAAVICYYRDDAFHLAAPDDTLRNGDEVVILTSAEQLPRLKERWEPRQGGEEA